MRIKQLLLSGTIGLIIVLLLAVSMNASSTVTGSGWVSVAPQTQGITWGETVQSGDRLYTIGGSGASGGVSTVLSATVSPDGVLSTWTSVTALPNPLYIHAAVVSNDHIFVIGGWDGSNWRREVLQSKIQSEGTLGPWIKVGDYPTEIALHDAVAVGSIVYVVGGQNTNGGLSTVRYARVSHDGTLGGWMDTPPLPIPLYRLAVTATDKALYVTGGYDGASARSEVYYAPINPDGSLLGWFNIPTMNMSQARYYHGSHVVNGRLTVLGGYGVNGELADVCSAAILSNHTLGSWSCTEPPLPEPLQRFGSVVYPLHGKDAIYVTGGRRGDVYRNTVYLLTEPGMSLTLRNTPDTFVAPSQAITYSVGYQNRPFFDLTNVRVTATIPSSLELIPGSQGNGLVSGQQIVWTVPSVGKGQAGEFSYVARRPHPADGVTPKDDSGNPLHITKSGPLLATTNVPFTYSLSVTSSVPINTQVILTDTLPAGAVYVEDSGGGMVSGNVISWTVPGIQVNETITKTVNVSVTNPSMLTNEQYVVSGLHQITSTKPYTGAGYPAVGTAILPAPGTPPTGGEFNIYKSGPYVAQAGDRITYTLSLTSAVTLQGGIRFTDTLPDGATFITGTDVLTHSSGTITWEAPGLIPGSPITRQLVVTATKTITNASVTATATALVTTPITYSVSGRTSVVTHIAPPTQSDGAGVMAIQKSGPEVVAVGEPITYSLTVTTSVPLTGGLTVTDVLPASSFFVSSDGDYTATTNTVTWTTPALQPGETWTGFVEITATQMLTNSVYSVTASDGLSPTTSYSATGTVPVLPIVLPPEDLAIVEPDPSTQLYLTKFGPSSAPANSAITYTMVMSSGISIDRGITITEVLPAGATYLRSSDGGILQNGIVIWTVNSLSAQSTITRTFVVSSTEPIINLNRQYGATVSRTVTTTKPYTATGQTPVVTVVLPHTPSTPPPTDEPLVVTKSGPDHAYAGDEFSYTLAVSSMQEIDQGATLTDTLPAGVHAVSASHGGQINEQTVVWQLPSLSSGSSITRNVTVTASTHAINTEYLVTGRQTVTESIAYAGTAHIPVVTVILPPGGDGTLFTHKSVQASWQANGATGESSSTPVFNPSYTIYMPSVYRQP